MEKCPIHPFEPLIFIDSIFGLLQQKKICINIGFCSVLMREDSKLVAVHEGKYYKRTDGLAVGPGCFTRGLEYATGKKATVIGKPNPYFFNCAIPEGVLPHECCMIGDVSASFDFPLFTLFPFHLQLQFILLPSPLIRFPPPFILFL